MGISCVWIFKGHQLAFEHSEDWQVGRGSLFSSQWIQSTLQVDYASYDWVKLDPSLPVTRDVVNQYLRLYQMIKTQVLTENKHEVFLLKKGLKKKWKFFHDFCN